MTSECPGVLNAEFLSQKAEAERQNYASARPFPSIVFDDFFPAGDLDRILREYPEPTPEWFTTTDETSIKKFATRNEMQMSPFIRHFIYQLNSSTFIEFLEKLTGINGLIPDPHMFGGGLHQTFRGGFLKVHADFNRYERLKLDRRINLLLYLNKDWEDSYGGHLELWTKDMRTCVKKIAPIFNRVAIFSTTDFAYHGHPDPILFPPGRSRKSIALYYYTNGRPVDEVSESHSTLYQRRAGTAEILTPRRIAEKIVPPIIFDVLRKLRR